jgi:DNA polymerase IIIc chi subunit
MKKVSILLIGFLSSMSIQAQQKTSAVSIIVNGSKNLQMSIDERNSNLYNNKALVEKTTVSMDNLAIGQHSLLVVRTNQNNDRTERIATTFNLRYDYDMLIKVNRNGSLELIETKHTGTSDNLVAMSSSEFNILLSNVRNQRSTIRRSSAITNAFNNKYYFTTSQVIQLLQLVNSESSRIQLAKQSYSNITDRGNFYQLYELLNSQAGRNELEDFVDNYNDDRNSYTAMSDANFNILFQDIKKQWPDNIQMNSLTNAFINTNNYFSSYQASQLIQLTNSENNRLQLAKLSYRSITDPGNFNQVYNLISSQAGKNELTAYVNNYNNGISPDMAMSDANFNILYQDINRQWSDNTQMTSLTNAFNNTNNFFSSYQASQLIQLINGENNRLQLAKLSYRSITDRGNFNQVASLISSQPGKNELTAYVNNYNQGNGSNIAMSDVNFNNLYQDINRQWPENNQMTSLTNAFNNTNNFFSSYQASQLIQIIIGENNRLRLAKLSYRSITDPGNFNQVYNLISSQAGKNELTDYVNNNYNTGSSPNVAMSDANFTTLIQTIERQYLPFEQMNSLTDVFNNTNNYFSSAQVKQLIPLVSYESNRLQLAKLSYRTITDRSNFDQLYDLLNR